MSVSILLGLVGLFWSLNGITDNLSIHPLYWAFMYNQETKQWEGYIYKIYSDIDDKIYIGQTQRTIDDRWNSHLSAVRNRGQKQITITTVMRLYGEEHFSCVKVKKISCKTKKMLEEQLDKDERYYISLFNTLIPNGYNCSRGGHGKGSGKPIVQYTYNGEVIGRYNNCVEAARITGLSSNAICDCCKGRTYRTNVGIFRYLNDGFDKFDTSRCTRPPNSKRAIVMYNSNGDILDRFDSMCDCSKSLHIDRAIVSRHIALHYCKDGYVLFFEDEEFDANVITHEFPKRFLMIKRINKETLEEVIYESKTEACRLNHMNMSKLNNKLCGRSVDFDKYIYEYC